MVHRMATRMPFSWRQAAIFLAGLLVGGAAAAWLVLHPPKWPATDEPRVAAEAAAETVASRNAVPCPAQAAAPPAGDKDGQFDLEPDLSRNKVSDITAFVIIGKEAAASGRARDAEVSFIMSCRVADRFKGAGSLDAAEARYQLGRHYANLVLNGGPVPAASRAELLKRADQLYADSLGAYTAKYGEAHEKSRFAAEGLARVRQNLARATPASAAPQPAQAVAQSQPQPRTQTGPAPAPVVAQRAPTQEMGAPSRPRPSFNCAKAWSPSEKAICADPELSRLDSELGRLHARAKSAARDKRAFNRQNDSEWRKRESTCRGDRQCLREWYDLRRNQLLNDLDES
jgi:hypothetical protein